jgi:hypothetical protein
MQCLPAPLQAAAEELGTSNTGQLRKSSLSGQQHDASNLPSFDLVVFSPDENLLMAQLDARAEGHQMLACRYTAAPAHAQPAEKSPGPCGPGAEERDQ